jgi:hypothetical protein
MQIHDSVTIYSCSIPECILTVVSRIAANEIQECVKKSLAYRN